MFLKLMDANADTIETHFALGALYRRRGEVERAIRIHQNLLAREALAPEHREQALLALAQDYLRAGLLDRAEGLFQQVSEVPRLRASALAALRGVYERQHEWQQALDTYGGWRAQGGAARARWPRIICASSPRSRSSAATSTTARELLRQARREASPFPRAALLRAQIAERAASASSRCGCCARRWTNRRAAAGGAAASAASSSGDERRDAQLAELVAQARDARRRRTEALVFAAIAAGLGGRRAAARRDRDGVRRRMPTLECAVAGRGRRSRARRAARSVRCSRMPSDIGAASAASRGAASTGIVPHARPGRVSRPMRWSNCVENSR